MDFYVVFAASDTHALGGDVSQPLAFDPLGRPHVYSSWWLGLSQLGLSRSSNLWFSSVLGSLFAVALFWQLRPSSLKQLFYNAALICSFPFVLAVERANNDLVIYLLFLAVLAFLRVPRSPWSLVGFLLLLFAAGLKYYPLIGLVLLLELSERRAFWLRGLLIASAVLLAGVLLWKDLQRSSALFQLPYGLVGIGSGTIAQVFRIEGPLAEVARLLPGVAVFWLVWFRTPAAKCPPAELQSSERAFLLGALVLCASFWLTINHSYRWIFTAFLVPHLWRQLQAGGELSLPERRQSQLLLRLLVAVPWLTSLCCALLILNGRILGVAELFELSDRLCLLLQVPIWLFMLLLVGRLARFAKPRVLWLLRPCSLGVPAPAVPGARSSESDS